MFCFKNNAMSTFPNAAKYFILFHFSCKQNILIYDILLNFVHSCSTAILVAKTTQRLHMMSNSDWLMRGILKSDWLKSLIRMRRLRFACPFFLRSALLLCCLVWVFVHLYRCCFVHLLVFPTPFALWMHLAIMRNQHSEGYIKYLYSMCFKVFNLNCCFRE